MKGTISVTLLKNFSRFQQPQIRLLGKFSDYASKDLKEPENLKVSKDDEIKKSRINSSPDLPTLLNPKNRHKIVQNLVDRLIVPTEKEAQKMLENLQILKDKTIQNPSEESRKKLSQAALNFPNFSHAAILNLKEPKTVFDNTKKLDQSHLIKVRSFEEISKVMNGSRTSDTGQTSTDKSYYLQGPFAELEQALINFTIDYLVNRSGFTLISVPDILDTEIIQACGVNVEEKKNNNVFKLDPDLYGNVALSGTSEMAFGSFFANKKIDFQDSNVKKFAAVSRCFRHETSQGKREKGLYRVHYFTKVEMFAVVKSDMTISDMIHEQFLSIQQRLFDDLELYYRVLDMHPGDLGSPASRKFDCEAILPGHEILDANEDAFYGEISSTSNCLDYQSRRLNLKEEATNRFCHTVNGTACAIPRMIMAICEQKQLANGCIDLPRKLRPFMQCMENSHDDYLSPRDKKKRPVFQYKTSPKAFISN